MRSQATPRNSYSFPLLNMKSQDPFTSTRSRTRDGLAKPATNVPAGITTCPVPPNAFTSCVTSPKTGVSLLDESTVSTNEHGINVALGRYNFGSGTGVALGAG